MTALGLFLFCLFIQNIHSCIVIRYVEPRKSHPTHPTNPEWIIPAKCNCPVLALDSKNIKSQVADHSFYSNISSRPIIAPIVSIDECYGSLYCEGDYNLVVFDTKTATNFGEYAADGLCDRYTQTWLVDDLISGGFTTFQRLYATCVDYKDYGSCKPNDDLPLFFAYSNDFDSDVVVNSMKWLIYPQEYSMLANVRFDVQQEEQIDYHSVGKNWTNSINQHLPDPSLSFTSNEIGSDVLKVIEKFLDNTEIPICGTKIIILVKRNPNEVDIARIVQKLRGNHIHFYVSASTSPSGGSQNDTMYNLASQTNGYCLFDNDDRIPTAIAYGDPFIKRPMVYAVNRQVSGKGTMELPPRTLNELGAHYLSVTFQDSAQSFPYSRLTLRWENNKWTDPDASNSTAFYEYLEYGGAQHGQYKIYLFPTVNNLSLEYNYADDKLRTIQIRMLMSDYRVDYWIPYDT